MAKNFSDMGTTNYAESGSAGGTKIGFKDAFRAARKQGLKNFSWQGKKYTTELASEKKPEPKKSDASGSEPAKPSGPSTRGGARRQEVTVTAKREKPLSLPDDRATRFAKDMRGLDEERAKSALKSMATVASMAPLGRAARAAASAPAARRSIGERGLEMSKREETAERMEKFRKQMEARQKLSPGAVYKSGGGVKKYARGGGIERRGKTRGKFI